jgi:hypothetical protein
MRIVSNKTCRENENTHFMFSIFSPENRAVINIMSANTVEPEAANGNMAARFLLD